MLEETASSRRESSSSRVASGCSTPTMRKTDTCKYSQQNVNYTLRDVNLSGAPSPLRGIRGMPEGKKVCGASTPGLLELIRPSTRKKGNFDSKYRGARSEAHRSTVALERGSPHTQSSPFRP
eukprot:6501075-Pyramimonas_sp.AAC.3